MILSYHTYNDYFGINKLSFTLVLSSASTVLLDSGSHLCELHKYRPELDNDGLDNTHPNQWNGKGSLFPWPARFPDLIVLDFYSWDRLKDVLKTPENMIDRLQNVIKKSRGPRSKVLFLATIKE